MKPDIDRNASFFIAGTAMSFAGPFAYLTIGRSYYSSIAIIVVFLIIKTIFFVTSINGAKAANDEISPGILALSATIDMLIVIVMVMKAKTHFIRPPSLPMLNLNQTKPIIKSFAM